MISVPDAFDPYKSFDAALDLPMEQEKFHVVVAPGAPETEYLGCKNVFTVEGQAEVIAQPACQSRLARPGNALENDGIHSVKRAIPAPLGG